MPVDEESQGLKSSRYTNEDTCRSGEGGEAPVLGDPRSELHLMTEKEKEKEQR